MHDCMIIPLLRQLPSHAIPWAWRLVYLPWEKKSCLHTHWSTDRHIDMGNTDQTLVNTNGLFVCWCGCWIFSLLALSLSVCLYVSLSPYSDLTQFFNLGACFSLLSLIFSLARSLHLSHPLSLFPSLLSPFPSLFCRGKKHCSYCGYISWTFRTM